MDLSHPSFWSFDWIVVQRAALAWHIPDTFVLSQQCHARALPCWGILNRLIFDGTGWRLAYKTPHLHQLCQRICQHRINKLKLRPERYFSRINQFFAADLFFLAAVFFLPPSCRLVCIMHMLYGCPSDSKSIH